MVAALLSVVLVAALPEQTTSAAEQFQRTAGSQPLPRLELAAVVRLQEQAALGRVVAPVLTSTWRMQAGLAYRHDSGPPVTVLRRRLLRSVEPRPGGRLVAAQACPCRKRLAAVVAGGI